MIAFSTKTFGEDDDILCLSQRHLGNMIIEATQYLLGERENHTQTPLSIE